MALNLTYQDHGMVRAKARSMAKQDPGQDKDKTKFKKGINQGARSKE